MQTFALNQVQQAQDHRPQVERFITATAIYVVETMADYDDLPSDVQTLVSLRNQPGF